MMSRRQTTGATHIPMGRVYFNKPSAFADTPDLGWEINANGENYVARLTWYPDSLTQGTPEVVFQQECETVDECFEKANAYLEEQKVFPWYGKYSIWEALSSHYMSLVFPKEIEDETI